MSAIENPTIHNSISREIKDINGLKSSTQQYKDEILINLGIHKTDSSIFLNIKNYLINIFKN